jgi:DNA/RNA-binding domain of Phe-tRNA-synthetase-like protein
MSTGAVNMVITQEPFVPAVDEAIWSLRPDFIALSIVVRGARNGPSVDAAAGDLRAAAPPWGDAHLEAWRQAYAAFGAKPKRTPCSAEALLRRVERDGELPRINALVDLYNALSVRYALPIGGEDLAMYRGTPRLMCATGGETFATMRDGEPAVETVEPGEVVWRDDEGVTCRRWNWRQSVRTRLDIGSTDLWFVLERLEPMPVIELERVGDALVAGVLKLAPNAAVTTMLLTRQDRAR